MTNGIIKKRTHTHSNTVLALKRNLSIRDIKTHLWSYNGAETAW